MPMPIRRLPILVVLLLPLAALSAGARADVAIAMEILKEPGAVALTRHAYAPGTGDPAAFEIGDCSTQRNLNDDGRAQARALGATFRDHGIARARVFSSQWCRCSETAELLDLGAVVELPAANSFFRWRERREPQTAELKAFIADLPPGPPAMIVTHQVNISALTGEYMSSGETVIVRVADDGEVEVLASFETPRP